jgi:hypothetical protein
MENYVSVRQLINHIEASTEVVKVMVPPRAWHDAVLETDEIRIINPETLISFLKELQEWQE